MSPQEKLLINSLRLKGYNSFAIAKELNISPSTIRSYIYRNPIVPGTKQCLQCGAPIIQDTKRKEKKFCCDKCRNAWWKAHPSKINRKTFYTLTCEHCGKEFESYGNKKRKFCTRACYIESKQR